MTSRNTPVHALCLRFILALLALFQFNLSAAVAGPMPNQNGPSNDNNTTTPVKHVIVIIGENRSFDHVFATYVPRRGETVNNLLSEGIITLDSKKDAVPGPNFERAHQLAATSTDAEDESPAPIGTFPSTSRFAPPISAPDIRKLAATPST